MSAVLTALVEGTGSRETRYRRRIARAARDGVDLAGRRLARAGRDVAPGPGSVAQRARQPVKRSNGGGAQEGGNARSVSWDQFGLYLDCNLRGTQRLLEALRAAGDVEKRRLVQVSTSTVYGVEAFGDETALPRPANPYGITKLAAEQ